MSNTKITELTELAATPADADVLEIVDDVAGTPTSKKITAGNLRGGLAASGANADITSMTGLSNDGIPLAKVANAASDGANSDITSLSAVSIPTINLTGGQIAFPATAVPSADANTLDDYEEGEHTATVTCSTSGSYTTATYTKLAYVKIGGVVHIQGYLSVTSETAPSGSILISLPFEVTNLTEEAGNIAGSAVLMDHGGTLPQVSAYLTGGVSYFRLMTVTDGGVSTTINESHVDSAWRLRVGFSYIST